MLQVSVIVPTYQRCAAVARLLQSLCQQSLPPNAFEVIVVIDGSQDGTQKWLEQFAAPYALRWLWQTNSGRAAACNAGVALAQGELIVLLDDDMVATNGLLAGHAAMHECSPRVAVVGAAPIQVSANTPPLTRWMADGFAHRLARFAQTGYQIRYSEAYSGNFSIRRSVMMAVGGFDEGFKIYGYEDYEMALRLTRMDVRLVYGAEALAHQYYEKSFPNLVRDSIARGRSAVLFANKHPEVISELKLGAAEKISWKWRLLRKMLLTLTHYWNSLPDLLAQFVEALERQPWLPLPLVYSLILDYCYWVGVVAAQRESKVDEQARNG